MDRPSTPKKLTRRPPLPRSQSATADTSPPQRSQTALRQALPGLHLPTRPHYHHNHHNHHDKHKRSGDKQASGSGALTSPWEMSTVLADKLGPNRSSARVGREAANTIQNQDRASERGAAPIRLPEKSIKPVEVAKERHRRVRREEELRSTLTGLTELASDSTRRVDMLFLGITEKVASLRSTIQELQALSTETARLQGEFERKIGDAAKEYAPQVDAFKGFEGQQEQVKTLRNRIKTSVERSEKLQERLRGSRDRIAMWEKREDEWQANTSMKLKIGWACFGVLMAVIMVLLVIKAVWLRTRPLPITRSQPNTSDTETLWKQLHIRRPLTPASWLVNDSTAPLLPQHNPLRILDEL